MYVAGHNLIEPLLGQHVPVHEAIVTAAAKRPRP